MRRGVCSGSWRGSRASEPQPARENEIDRNGRQPLPAVSIRTRADGNAVALAAKLASGAAEALELDQEPARRLATVVVEGTRNAVEHAYAGLTAGDVELELALRRGGLDSGEDELVVTIRDFGAGCSLGPTANEPPGLGLSIISELSEALRISSQRQAGTVVDATIRVGGGDAAPRRAATTRGSRLEIGDPAFLAPVIPRAIAVHAAAGGGSVDAVRAAIESGRSIAVAIAPETVAGRPPTLAIDCPERSEALEVLIGPIAAGSIDGLRERLRSHLDAAAATAVDQRRLRVSFPLL